ncbi:hypothetical protein ABZ927_18840 [Streptomyces massasporeus]
MGCTVLDLGRQAVRIVVRMLPLLTSRRHIDLLRVCSAASSLHGERMSTCA